MGPAPAPSAFSVSAKGASQTASSGEGALIALRGRGTTSFGSPTIGVPTGDEFQMLTDGSAVNLTTAVGTEPSGTRYEDEIAPDVEVPADATESREQATAWLQDTPGC